MSNHFTYEINERNLRIQLKEFILPVKEDAWQKFEAFSDSMVSHQRENRFAKINLNLNRSVVLPSVFGIIIILFSFLLVNFVSIKNPVKEKESAQKPEPAAQPDQKIPEIKAAAVPVEAVRPVTAPPNTTAEIKAAENQVAHAPIEEKQPVMSPQPAIETPALTVEEAEAKAEAQAKRRAKRRAEAIETQQLMEIRPTLISEERDSEIRPN